MPFLLDYPLDDFRTVLDTNLIAPFLLIKKLLPAMAEEGGSIINVTSDAGVVGYPGWGAYGISKFGIEGMSHTWAAELAGSKVRLNWVDPGSMDTAMHRAAEPDEDPSQWADPADVTDVFVYLASDESRSVHGRRFAAKEPGWGWSRPITERTVAGRSHVRERPRPASPCRPSWRPSETARAACVWRGTVCDLDGARPPDRRPHRTHAFAASVPISGPAIYSSSTPVALCPPSWTACVTT